MSEEIISSSAFEIVAQEAWEAREARDKAEATAVPIAPIVPEVSTVPVVIPVAEVVTENFIKTNEGSDVKRTKVALCGFASNWQDCPWDDMSFEIWGLNELYNYFKTVPNNRGRAERWFEIHSRTSPTKGVPEHQAWLKQCPIPVYMWEHYDDIPNSVKYPVDEVLAFANSKGLKLSYPDGTEELNRYGTNSVSWMFLLAWMEGFTEIHIYGVDLAQNEEYYYQRPNLEYYIGAAQATGIKVVMPKTCDLLKAFSLYGFETDGPMPMKMKMRYEELKKTKDQHLANYNKAQSVAQNEHSQIDQIEGHLTELKYWIKNWRI